MGVKLVVYAEDESEKRVIDFKEVHRSDTGGTFAIRVHEGQVTMSPLLPEQDTCYTDSGVTFYYGSDQQALINARAHAKMLAQADVAIGGGIVESIIDDEED